MNARAINLFLCGDVMTGRGIDQILPSPGSPRIDEPALASATGYVDLAERRHGPIPRPVEFAYVWGDALEELDRRAPDLRLVNLETSITRSEERAAKEVCYRMSPANVHCLTAAGIDCCVLANNHVLDWGRSGLVETLATLEKAGIATAGAGRDASEALRPAVMEMPGKGRVVVFSFGSPTSGIPGSWAAAEATPGVNLLADLSALCIERIAGQVRAVKRTGDVVVASLHWGGNWGYEVSAAQRAFAQGLIEEAGVDLVHGHSSHHGKGIEVHRERAIFYGCGDFLDDYEGIAGYEAYRDDLVLMYFVSLSHESGALLGCEMKPLQIRNFRLNRACEEDAAWLLQVLNRESAEFGTAVEPTPDGNLRLVWR